MITTDPSEAPGVKKRERFRLGLKSEVNDYLIQMMQQSCCKNKEERSRRKRTVSSSALFSAASLALAPPWDDAPTETEAPPVNSSF